MEDLSLHILDVVENSLRAGAKRVEIILTEDTVEDVLTLQITDDGKGMTPGACARAADPFFTTKPGRRTGLGLALLAQAAREAGGELRVSSSAGVGTTVRATFRWSHPDCRPLGDISATLEALVVGNPAVDFVCEQRRGADIVRFDTREVRHTWST
jgi:anti-sigma regulatory factor (Ser/Thr protein kinase)